MCSGGWHACGTGQLLVSLPHQAAAAANADQPADVLHAGAAQWVWDCSVRRHALLALPGMLDGLITAGGRHWCWPAQFGTIGGRAALNRKQTPAGCWERAAAFGLGPEDRGRRAGFSGDGSGAGGAAGGRCGSR